MEIDKLKEIVIAQSNLVASGIFLLNNKLDFVVQLVGDKDNTESLRRLTVGIEEAGDMLKSNVDKLSKLI